MSRLLIATLFLLLVVAVPGFAEETQSEGPGFWDALLLPKVWLAAVFSLWGLSLLAAGAVNRRVRLIFLGLIFFLWGVVPVLPLEGFSRGMGLHPSPLCMTARPFQFLAFGRAVPIPFITLLLATAVLSVLGTKLFCGWACPIGALQELAHAVPVPNRLKRTVPFRISNTVRVSIFVLFLILMFGFKFYIYDYINAFHFLHWSFEALNVVIISVVLITALMLYRPFCHHICPLGLFTWLFEQLAITRVRLTKSACTSCGSCTRETGCPAVPAILEGARIRPDCHSCGRCIEVCQEGALTYK